MDKQKIFPKNFLWGASTAAHQVEGGNYNQWTVWELEHAQQLAKSAHRRLGHLPIWEQIKTQAADPNNYVSGKGIEHYQRFKEDFDIAKSLQLNAFRFGIEWSRIEPRPGEYSEEALQHYREYIAELKKRGIEPILNLWHWTMPVWFTEKGGFERTSNLADWRRFVEKIGAEYASELKYIITVNEPNVYVAHGYQTAKWPPSEKSRHKVLLVYWNLVRAHRQAYAILKRHNPKLKIGVAQQLANIQAKRPHNYFDQLSTKIMRYVWNWWFLRRIRKQQDFVGFNYYFTDYYTGLFQKKNPNVPLNDLGWYMEPEGLYPLLIRAWTRYKKPIMITENGVADMNDEYRQWWLEQSIIAMQRAISEGVEVIGYMHWSLLDNFEWADGWWPRFGLVAVDRANGMKRTIRHSALWYAGKIKKLKSQTNTKP
jgi:beta-glucosidase